MVKNGKRGKVNGKSNEVEDSEKKNLEELEIELDQLEKEEKEAILRYIG
ncbi:MAG: hypothetical protein K6T16_00575 [Candidatus Pacearchaeota archaeon]|nr:hypothetical protein [Candidatus Pacearchaeota archaeon]